MAWFAGIIVVLPFERMVCFTTCFLFCEAFSHCMSTVILCVMCM